MPEKRLQWTPPKLVLDNQQQLPGNYAIVWVDVRELDRLWQGHEHGYIDTDNSRADPTKYERAERIIVRESGPIEMPILEIGKQGEIQFCDGRHRTAVCRNHGVQAIPVIALKEHAAQLMCRSDHRVSLLPITPEATPHTHHYLDESPTRTGDGLSRVVAAFFGL